MSDNKIIDNSPERKQLDAEEINLAPSSSEVSSVTGSVKTARTPNRVSSSSERQIKFERAQKCLENAALVSKRIKEHRKATAELLGRPFEEDDGDTASEMASTMSERTGYSAATDTSTTLSVQDALNIPGISESLANTLKQKEILMERIKQYKEISKRPAKSSTFVRKESIIDSKLDTRKAADNSDITQLTNTLKERDNALSVMQVKIKAMETTILDLQEKVNEKDQIIEAKNMATTLMSDTLSKKEKDSFALLEDTRMQMTKMQENFIAMETEWHEEKQKLLKDIQVKDEKICSLEEANKILEASRFEISLAHSKLAEELEIKVQEIAKLEMAVQNLTEVSTTESSPKEKLDVEEEKGSREVASMVELTKKIELLEQLNCQIRQTNKELENKLATINTEPKSAAGSSQNKKGSPVPTRKTGRNTASKMKSPWSHLSSETLHQDTDKKLNKNEISRLEMVIQSLNKEILEKEYIISQKQELISELQSATTQSAIAEVKGIDMVDVGICTEFVDDSETRQSTVEFVTKDNEGMESQDQQPVDIKLINEKLKSANEQIALLNNEIKAANKNMIKEKSTHKLKVKQMQKTIDNFSKMSDNNAEIARLNEELHQLSQKVAELEEEKGNLQLHLVDYDSGRLTESDVYKKMLEMENLAESRLQSISVLEAQKFDLVQELHVLQQKNNEMEDKLADISQLQSEHVCSEMKSVQLEEQIDQLTASRKELEIILDNLKLDKEQLNGTIKLLEKEKEELMHKLENYIQENMELTDKLEKLSAEKVSSAESIEIVESLTTQEKLELAEYNKGMESKVDDEAGNITPPNENNLETLMEQSADLNNKIELFTQEREEVLAKMSKISTENNFLHKKITDLTNECGNLQTNIDVITNEKIKLQELNEELNHHIEELKRERVEILKETVEMAKPSAVDEPSESMQPELHQDEKSVGDKNLSRTKSVKQLTKEILKLKNTIKEREAEIADSQMKILSLEEQQQKHNELLHSVSSYEYKVKTLTDENYQLKEEIEVLSRHKDSEQQILQYKQANEYMQQDIQKIHQEYSATVSSRDARINELESLLLEYEKQICNYGNTIQQKDKEMTEYINQITKLNDVSQKLKSTIELLEEEKAKDQNAELVKSLNKQLNAFQKKLADFEKNISLLEEEKSHLLSVKVALENKNVTLDTELQKLQEAYNEKQSLIVELQTQKQKHKDEVSELITRNKERDEEIHEIKLQLRKESIENEKLRTNFIEKDKELNEMTQAFSETKENYAKLSFEKDNLTQEFTTIETKNKELLEKLKKFAVNIKKKASMYTDLETAHHEIQKQLEAKNAHLEQLIIQVETIPVLQDKLKHAEEAINRLQVQKNNLDSQKSQDILQMQSDIASLENKLMKYTEELSVANDSLNCLTQELNAVREENAGLITQVDSLNKKIVEYEIDQKNSSNFVTKIAAMEADINQKENQIAELLNKYEQQDTVKTQMQFGYDAKIQERDLYIENLEAEISKYKGRICRLEDSVSIMEDRRHSLERKADQLGSQLQEKQKAYNEYTNQEDELVSRLAVLMDHDRVVEKQLYEIENENKELQNKVQYLMDDNQRLRKSLSDIQEHCNQLVDKASRFDIAESEIAKYQSQIQDRDIQLKRITNEYQTLIVQKKKEIEEIELEFNSQIETAIKDKKVLSEKYEKNCELVSQLELKIKEYTNNIENLNLNIEELNRVNEELMAKSSSKDSYVSPDYTEQYVSEINKLNSVVNSKNQEISELSNRFHIIQTNHLALVSKLESNISDLNVKLNNSSEEIARLLQTENELKRNNAQLQMLLSQKEELIKELKETKLTFEMSIPKTEGMVISSTIEPLSEDTKGFDISSLESQIISDSSEPIIVKKDKFDQSSILNEGIGRVNPENVEPIITQKKAYVCSIADETQPSEETDPFNSEEGWGLGENEEDLSVTPGLTHLQDKIEQLKKDNGVLKSELDASNTKLMKAVKRLKELKSSNDMLTNELKLSKQISQSSFLDSAIEDELRINIQELEKKVEELSVDLNKEKREKESIKKQNEVFSNANERLTEMKEKLDNEIELWKYKFKEANDKVSSLQWDEDPKNNLQSPVRTVRNVTEDQVNEEIMKIEKENEELQVIIDQLTLRNKELLSEQSQLKSEISDLNSKITQHTSSFNDYEILQNNYLDLQQSNTNLQRDNEILKEKLDDLQDRLNNATEEYKFLKTHYENIEVDLEEGKRNLTNKCSCLEQEINSLKQAELEMKNDIIQLTSDLDMANSKLMEYEELRFVDKQSNANVLQEQCTLLETQASKLTQDLQDAHIKISHLESDNAKFLKQITDYNDKINELNAKVENLNSENDNLLSTVAELRSSVSSAVDQRGFEIAELWKQHLAQRETDFQKTEHELRTQLSASEAKYEQLLDNVQSSSQEETSKLIMAEQLTSIQNKLQEKEDHLHTLQEKYAEVMNQLDVLRSEMDDEKVNHDNRLLEQQEEYEKVIQELTSKTQQNTDSFEQSFKNINEELASCKASNDELIHQNNELQNKISELETDMSNLTKQIHIKDSEIYQKTHDYCSTISQRNEEFENVRKQLLEFEKKIEDLSYEKESELAIMRLKMHENVNHCENLQNEFESEKISLVEALNTKITECTNLNKQITDLNRTIEEQTSKITELQAVLENQEVEIVSLKDEISNLNIMLKSSTSKMHRHVSFASDTKPGDGENPEGSLNNDLLDAVPRAELDLALYMLHQRDVRCEELTMELTQLLEERDTLQLRLSDSLRSYEDLKSKCKSVDSQQPITITQETVSELPSFNIEREHQFVETHRGQTSRSSSISDPDGEKPKLQAKLSELRSVKHSRDVRFRHESEQRQLDLRLLQSDVANLPPEAVSQLTQAHHTLSRDSQSTSTVLLNWLRGKSTPKVVHM